MPTLSIEHRSDAERLLLEQAIAFVTPMRQVAARTPDRIPRVSQPPTRHD
jgi:hypothetical protein